MIRITYQIVITILLIAVGEKRFQEPSQTSTLIQDYLPIVKHWSGFETTKETINEFQKKAKELLKDDGTLQPGVRNADLGQLVIISCILCEHFQLRGLKTDAAEIRFGSPLAILEVRQNTIFSDAIHAVIDWTEDTNGVTIWQHGRETLPMKCLEYGDLYVWTTDKIIWAISPRSARFDNYVKEISQ